MVRATKAAAKPAPEPVEEEAPLAKLLDKEPSEVHNRFVDYIEDQVGYECDPKTVQLVISQWQKFQKTPEQQEFTKQRKEAAAAAREEREAKAAAAPAAEKPARGRRSAAKAVEVDEEDEAPARPTRGRRPAGTATPAPAKRATTRRRATVADGDPA